MNVYRISGTVLDTENLVVNKVPTFMEFALFILQYRLFVKCQVVAGYDKNLSRIRGNRVIKDTCFTKHVAGCTLGNNREYFH